MPDYTFIKTKLIAANPTAGELTIDPDSPSRLLYHNGSSVQQIAILDGGKIDEALLSAQVPYFVKHTANAATARPVTPNVVFWQGTVAPDNALAGDLWLDHSVIVSPLLKRYTTANGWSTVGGAGGGAAAGTTFSLIYSSGWPARTTTGAAAASTVFWIGPLASPPVQANMGANDVFIAMP